MNASESYLLSRQAALFAVLIAFFPMAAVAELARLEITHREPWAGGREFGARGAYERLRGRAGFEVEPGGPATRRVVAAHACATPPTATPPHLTRPAAAHAGSRRPRTVAPTDP